MKKLFVFFVVIAMFQGINSYAQHNQTHNITAIYANRGKYCDIIFQVAGPLDKIHMVLTISCMNKNL